MSPFTSDVIALTKQLIACPSVTPFDAGCQFIIREKLMKLGFVCESMRFNDVDNLWARYGTKTPLLVFAGHTDVVPSGPETDWTSSPFHPVEREGYLYGRGTTDMKSAIAAMLVAVENFLMSNHSFDGSIAFLITSDEEGLSIDGTKKVIEVLEKRGEKIDYCLIGEPSSDRKVGDQIRVGRRGSLHGKLTVQGKQGHVAHPHLALNPIHHAMLSLHDLAHQDWDQGNEHFPPTTLQITNIHSGTGASNVIPGHLEALFNLRFSTASQPDHLQHKIAAIFDRYQLNYSLEWNISAYPFLSQQGQLLHATQSAIKEITGLEVKLSTGGGTSDGRFIAPTGAEVIELGCPHATAHQVDECVKISDLEELTKIYRKILDYLSCQK